LTKVFKHFCFRNTTIILIKTLLIITLFITLINATLYICYHVRYLSTLLYKYYPATEFTKLRSTQFKDGATLAPKLANLLSFWRSSSTPFKYWIKYSWSGSTHILYYINMSVRWNTLLSNQILSCQHIFYYKAAFLIS